MLDHVKKLLKPLANTPLHPQWLVRGGAAQLENMLGAVAEKAVVLDIGCYDKWARTRLPETVDYVGLDYLSTADDWYKTVPDVYADAHQLPVANSVVDVVLLLDVLEHLADANTALSEVHRVLSDEGTLIMQIPFLYPLHDEPRDFSRITKHGYAELAKKHGFKMVICQSLGHPVETSVLLTNIAWSKTILNWISQRNPAALLILVFPFFVVAGNLIARLTSWISASDLFMPYSYQVVWQKD